jgi:ketosteroid isomerase-like protein
MSAALDRFISLYQGLDKRQLHRLREVYAEDVLFVDPAHRIQGLAALEHYFAELYGGLESCTFEIERSQQQGDCAWLGWTMTLRHPRLARGAPVSVRGATVLEFNDAGQVRLHQDYFDLGAMLYEQLPLLGPLVRIIKGRLGK